MKVGGSCSSSCKTDNSKMQQLALSCGDSRAIDMAWRPFTQFPPLKPAPIVIPHTL
ncbi:hypothetical protein AM571_PC01541 (plasmid) [Rhizobium etli 8C-3]|uniref:Uncharacterized protein n=1 Tax=Rhizobium etli 8C-3 TaxID=538025 RepID=A0A1L5PGM1_RHIET|nr:hypothetical protein AM571_PC01541 [Rhizobium etli 8C-3]